MTPTSDERREVAERLRENASKHGVTLDYLGSTQVASWWLLLHTIGCNSNEQEAAFRMLADFIDPTCHVVPFDENRLSHCSSCGHPILKPWPNFCPCCGARVVTDDDQ